MNTWRMEQSARGFIKQTGNTYSGIDYGMYENGIGKLRIMFDGNFKNPSNAVNMLTGEKVAPNVISDGLKAIRGEKSALNIHLDKRFI
ncbi:unknown [Clostridium sp. CAG:813]|nr:unknown [Clostridium sp. CAG:813]